MGRIIVILLLFSKMSSGGTRNWKLNDRPIWYSFGKAGHDHTADVQAAKRLKYDAEKLGQERGWEERQNERI